MISRKFVEAVRLSSRKHYQLAHEAGIHPTTLSKMLNGIEKVKAGDRRIIRLGEILGLSEDVLFDSEVLNSEVNHGE